MVAGLQDAGQNLCGIAFDGDRAEGAVQLGTRTKLCMIGEATQRHLLLGEDRLGRDEVRDLVGVRDRTRHDVALGDLRRNHQMALDDVGARGADGDVALGDVHADGLLAVLHVPLVVGDVEQRQEPGHEGQGDRDEYVANAICHGGSFLRSEERES